MKCFREICLEATTTEAVEGGFGTEVVVGAETFEIILNAFKHGALARMVLDGGWMGLRMTRSRRRAEGPNSHALTRHQLDQVHRNNIN